MNDDQALWDNPAFHEGRIWGRKEYAAQVAADMANAEPDYKEHAKGYKEGQEDLYEWANHTVEEWHGLKIVTDNQYIWLLKLMHDLDKLANYTYDGDIK